MSATRILWGQLLFVSVVVLAFLWAATEWTAWRLGFQPQLGPAAARLLHLVVQIRRLRTEDLH
jgi:hypothetical protein